MQKYLFYYLNILHKLKNIITDCQNWYYIWYFLGNVLRVKLTLIDKIFSDVIIT